jgi:carboxyl-terminal processing protease
VSKLPNYVIPVAVIILVGVFGFGSLAGFAIGRTSVTPTVEIPPEQRLSQLDSEYINSLYELIDTYYLGELPSQQDLTYAVAKSIVETLGEYSSFLTPDEAKQYLAAGGNNYEGIGVTLEYNGEYTYLGVVLKGSPAEAAGLVSGDLILSIDGEDAAGQVPDILVAKIKGEAGTKVSMTVYRPSLGSAETFEVERAKIDFPNVAYSQLENGLVKIDIYRFTDDADTPQQAIAELNAAWDQVVENVSSLNPKGIIVDLRGNPGGYVQSVQYFLEDFLPADAIIMREKTKLGEEESYIDQRQGKLEGIPLVVWVDGASASASEIFAGAIQDNDRGQVIGVKTFGKGVEQVLLDLDDGAKMLLVYKHWLTSDGRQISSESPIVPDFETEDEVLMLEQSEKLLN